MLCESICSVRDREVHDSSILVETNLHLAVKLQPDLIIQAIPQVATILRKKLRLR